MKRSAAEEADRLMRLLDIGLDAMRNGDAEMTIMALQEAEKSAQRLPQKPAAILLPDRSSEAP